MMKDKISTNTIIQTFTFQRYFWIEGRTEYMKRERERDEPYYRSILTRTYVLAVGLYGEE